jgi:hypothetical protein
MTDSQALQEAKNRWGKDAKIEQMVQKRINARQSKRAAHVDIEYRVGVIKIQPVWGSVFVVKGIGHTWEEAFNDADRIKPLKIK